MFSMTGSSDTLTPRESQGRRAALSSESLIVAPPDSRIVRLRRMDSPESATL